MAEKQYVVFGLDGAYGIDILSIQEITRYEIPTRIPNMPEYMEGIINLRGSIVPVISLRRRFKREAGEITNESRIIIVDIGQKKIGFLVDSVSQVAMISEGDIEAPPEIVAGCDRKFIAGIGKTDKGMVILLEPHAVLSEDEKDRLKEMSA